MKNFKKKITNPMTVIAIFAFISESSAAVSLPFLDNKEREIYIWFLISFPFYLLLLFFITLNFNYRSLYAPSDFDKDDNFLKAFDELKTSEKKRACDSLNASLADKPKRSSESGSSENETEQRRTGNVPDPPFEVTPMPWIEHHIDFPKPTSTLRVVDVRQMNSKAQFDQLQDSLLRQGKQLARFIVFLTDPDSDALLRQIAFNPVKQTKKGSTNSLYVAYNVSMQVTTILRGD